jgi:alcohol dehydrogenase class IV
MEFFFPQHVHLGQGVSQRFGLTAKEAGARVLLLVDGAFDGSKELGILTHSLERASVPFLVLPRNPRQNLAEALKEAVSVAQASRMDVLAALGGADQLSLGRAAVIDLAATRAVPYFEVPSGVCYPLLLRPEVFLSTGHPSGLRFAPFAPRGDHFIFLDPHMATGQTPKASVSSLLEALFYAVEACLHDASGLTEQSLLVGAVEAVWSTLKQIYDNPANAEYRLLATQAGFNIAAACALGPRGAGVTFSFTLAGLAGLSTSAFGSLLLAPLLEYYAPKAGVRIRTLARAFGYEVAEGEEATVGPKIAQDVRKFLNAHKLPLRLADYQLVDTQITQAVDVVRGLDLRRGGILEPDQLPDFVRTVL